MKKSLASLRRFARDEEGASLAEYGLLLALIAVVCIAAINLLGTTVSSLFSNVGTAV